MMMMMMIRLMQTCDRFRFDWHRHSCTLRNENARAAGLIKKHSIFLTRAYDWINICTVEAVAKWQELIETYHSNSKEKKENEKRSLASDESKWSYVIISILTRQRKRRTLNTNTSPSDVVHWKRQLISRNRSSSAEIYILNLIRSDGWKRGGELNK